MSSFYLKLFITGQTFRSQKAVSNVNRLVENLGGVGRLEIIDVLERPQLAEEEGVLATPTLIKESPPPKLRVVGDLSDEEMVLERLGDSTIFWAKSKRELNQ